MGKPPVLKLYSALLGYVFRGQAHILGGHGIKIAPVEVALHFSIEYLVPTLHDALDFTRLVGCHGHRRKLIARNTVQYNRSRENMPKTYGEPRVLEYLESVGYQILFSDG